MIKNKRILFVLLLFIFALPLQTFATSMNAGEYYPPVDSDYHLKKISWKLYFDYSTVKVKITQYDETNTVKYQNEMTVTPNSYKWFDMTCKAPTSFEFFDAAGTSLGFATRGQDDGSNLDDSNCNYSNPVFLSDYNEQQNQYASDTFGGTKSPTNDPATSDGSGGTGAAQPPADNTGSTSGTTGSTGTTTDTTGSSATTCDSCQVFSCPEWDNYMQGISDIKNAIPPAPNWDNVAATFRDTITPQIKKDLQDVLGTAPETPAVPEQPAGVDDKGINNSVPTGQEDPGLGDSSFNQDQIKSEAPQIQERPDPTGGFSINDPVAGLPSQDEFKKNVPTQGENPLPAPPTPSDNVAPSPGTTTNNTAAPLPQDNTGNAPTPTQDSTAAPTPGGDSGTAPLPSDSGGTAPLPSDGTATAPLPNSGSGSAPLPSDSGGSAPLPSDGNTTAPLPGQ